MALFDLEVGDCPSLLLSEPGKFESQLSNSVSVLASKPNYVNQL